MKGWSIAVSECFDRIPKFFPSNRRAGDLAQLLGIADAEAEDGTIAGRVNLIRKLAAARRVEIQRGKSGSWLYDVNRHLNLTKSLRREKAALLDLMSGRTASCKEMDCRTSMRQGGQ